MKKILYTAIILACFSSQCMQQYEIDILDNNFKQFLKINSQKLQDKYPTLKVEAADLEINYPDKCLTNLHVLFNKACTEKYNIYEQPFTCEMNTNNNLIYYCCTLDNTPGYIIAADIYTTLFYFAIKNKNFKSAIRIANDRGLCKKDIIDTENVNFIYKDIAYVKNLLPQANQKFTAGELIENEKNINNNDQIARNDIDNIIHVLEYNQKLKNLFDYKQDDIKFLFFSDFQSLCWSIKEFSTTDILKKAIYKLADHNNMNTIDELLEEYCNQKHYYLHSFDLLFETYLICDKTKQQDLEKTKTKEVGCLLHQIENVMEKHPEAVHVLCKYILLAEECIANAIACNKYKLAEKIAKKQLRITDYEILRNLSQDKTLNTAFLKSSKEDIDITNLTLKNNSEGELYNQYIPIMMQAALSAIKERCFILAYHFLQKLNSLIDFNSKFTYKNEPYTFASYYSSNIYNKTRYFVEYKPNEWKMLNTNANEKLEDLIGWNESNHKEIKKYLIQKGDKKIIDMLSSIKPENFDILHSFAEELSSNEYLNFNAIFEINKKFYTSLSIFTKNIIVTHYPNIKNTKNNIVKDVSGNLIKSLTKNKFNMFIPNLEQYADTNFIKMIKEKKSNDAAVKNFTTYCLNDFINHQANNKKRFIAGSKLCLDIINKMLEIQSSCN